jgi:hypothetical protein
MMRPSHLITGIVGAVRRLRFARLHNVAKAVAPERLGHSCIHNVGLQYSSKPHVRFTSESGSPYAPAERRLRAMSGKICDVLGGRCCKATA